MTPTETAAILRQFNEWRRSDYEPSEQPAPPDPREIGEAIDAAIAMIEQLEAAESRLHEVAVVCATAEQERDELRAKIEAMESDLRLIAETDPVDAALDPQRAVRIAVHSLYLAPGAQPAPSINPAALSPVINWLRNGCDPMKAAYELEMLAAAPEAKP